MSMQPQQSNKVWFSLIVDDTVGTHSSVFMLPLVFPIFDIQTKDKQAITMFYNAWCNKDDKCCSLLCAPTAGLTSPAPRPAGAPI